MGSWDLRQWTKWMKRSMDVTDTPRFTHTLLTSDLHQDSHTPLLPLRYTKIHTHPSYLWDTPRFTQTLLPLRYTKIHTHPSYFLDTPRFTHTPLTSEIHQDSHTPLLPLRYTKIHTHPSYLLDTPRFTHTPLTSEIHQDSHTHLLPLRYTKIHTHASYLWDTALEPCIDLYTRSDPNLCDVYTTDVHVASQVEPDCVPLGLSCKW